MVGSDDNHPQTRFASQLPPAGAKTTSSLRRLNIHFDTSDDAATANPTGTKNALGASVSSITKHMAINGACCDAESNAAAPISAQAVTESAGNNSIQMSPSIAPSVDPNAMPGCNTPPEAPERMVISVTNALATNVSASTPSSMAIFD